MKIQYCSDLHLEFRENSAFLKENPILPEGDILILAGDIVPFARMSEQADFFDYLSGNFEATYWIPGNHEYYHSDLFERRGEFCEPIRENVWLVNNTWVNRGNTKIIFSTLWSRISPQNAWRIQTGLNDFNFIRYDGKFFSPYIYNQLFDENFEFIKNAVATNEREKCVVVTHHVPTYMNYPEEFKNSSLSDAFVVSLDEFIAGSEVDYWIYGHHHRNVPDFMIGNTQMLTNQLGYVKLNEHSDFTHTKFIVT